MHTQSLLLHASDSCLTLTGVDVFVRLRRYESMNLHQLVQGFHLLDCDWLTPQKTSAIKQRPTREEMIKRKSLLLQLLFYIFDSLLVPLLRTTFYATESARFRNRILYFRQDDWNSISQPILECLKQECFERVPKHKAVAIMSKRDFGYSFVRLLPKDVGMRPIINLRRRSVKIDRSSKVAREAPTPLSKDSSGWGQIVRQNQSINAVLTALFQVLTFERLKDARHGGSSVSGPQDIHSRLLSFKDRLSFRYGSVLPQLYFVKVDIAGAFDSIDQRQLLDIVTEIIQHVSRWIGK